jgi:hypothetical protein
MESRRKVVGFALAAVVVAEALFLVSTRPGDSYARTSPTAYDCFNMACNPDNTDCIYHAHTNCQAGGGACIWSTCGNQ